MENVQSAELESPQKDNYYSNDSQRNILSSNAVDDPEFFGTEKEKPAIGALEIEKEDEEKDNKKEKLTCR